LVYFIDIILHTPKNIEPVDISRLILQSLVYTRLIFLFCFLQMQLLG